MWPYLLRNHWIFKTIIGQLFGYFRLIVQISGYLRLIIVQIRMQFGSEQASAPQPVVLKHLVVRIESEF